MSENTFWASVWLCIALIVFAIVGGVYQMIANNNKTAIEMQNSCISNGGSTVVGRAGDQQCIRFAK